MAKREIKTKAPFVACAATMLLGASLMGGGAHAAPGDLTISVSKGDSQTGSSCYIYGGGTSDSCDETFGSYNSTNKTLTLGAGVNDGVISMRAYGSKETYTIKSNADIKASLLSVPSESTIKMDLGDRTWEVPQKDEFVFHTPDEGTFIMESGTLKTSVMIGSGNLQIEGGTIETTGIIKDGKKELSTGDINVKSFEMSGGTLEMKEGRLDVENALINGGTINVKSSYEIGGVFEVKKSFEMNSGTVTIDGGKASAHGINMVGGGVANFLISGGALNIKDVKYGINVDGSTDVINFNATFNGGVTTITNSSKYAIHLRGVKNPEKAIVFGNGMGIMEPGLYVYWVDSEWHDEGTEKDNQTGIVAEKKVTIAKGGEVKRVYGFEIGHGDTEEVGSSKISAPNTGIFSSEAGGGMIATISVGLLALVSGVGYFAAYLMKRCRRSVKFRS